MRKLIFLMFAFAFASAVQAIELKGKLTQGSLIRGKLPAGSKLWLDEQPVEVSQNGLFAFGFGRDAKLEHNIRWQLPDKSTHSKQLKLSKREYDVQRIDGLPPKMVTPPKETIARIRSDNRQVAKARAHRDNRTDFAEDFIWPSKGRISGIYGSQRVLNGKPRRPHFGVDVAAPTGTPIYAPASGLVTMWVPDMYYSGGTMIIDHGQGVSSTFLHMHKSNVEVGNYVKQGELIGEIGATGRVTGAHLDWRMNWKKARIDPVLLVPKME